MESLGGWQRWRRKGNITKKHDGEQEKEVEETMNATSEAEETRERT